MKILLLDDHPTMQMVLEQSVFEVTNNVEVILAGEVTEALFHINKDRVDFAMCDLQILTGKSLTVPSLCNDLELPYMVYSSHVNRDLIDSLTALNVSSYVCKSSSYEDLKKGIRALLSGGTYFCPVIRKTKEADRKEFPLPRLTLTKKQSQVLRLVVCMQQPQVFPKRHTSAWP